MKLKHQTKTVKITELVYNRGQLPGLPANPRFIRSDSFELMRKSIRETPGLLDLRPPIVYPLADGALMVIAGEMRSRAAVEGGHTELPVMILHKDTSVELLREITIKDNAHFGEWDMEELANSWGDDLAEWGVPSAWPDDGGAANGQEAGKKDPFDDAGITGKNAYGVIIMCETEDAQETVFKKMQADGYTCKIVVV